MGSQLVVAMARCPPPVEHLERVLPRPMGKQKNSQWSRRRVLAIFAWVQGEAASQCISKLGFRNGSNKRKFLFQREVISAHIGPVANLIRLRYFKLSFGKDWKNFEHFSNG